MVGPPRFRVDLSGMRERAIAREEYDREYRLVSGTRTILHLAAATNPGTRRLFQLVAVLRKRSAKTFNPAETAWARRDTCDGTNQTVTVTAVAGHNLDAAGAAWSAARFAFGAALPLPEGHHTQIGAIWR